MRWDKVGANRIVSHTISMFRFQDYYSFEMTSCCWANQSKMSHSSYFCLFTMYMYTRKQVDRQRKEIFAELEVPTEFSRTYPKL